MAPSRRIVSPLSIGLSMTCSAVEANSSGRPRRAGCGTWAARPSRISCGEAAEDRGVEDAGRDRADPDQRAGQVAGGDQGHADDAGLGRGVGDLADLALPGRDRGGEHADAALAVLGLVGGHPGGGEPQHVEGADQVDVDDLAVEVVVAGAAVLVDQPHGAAAPGAVHERAQRRLRGGDVERRVDALRVADVGGRERRELAELLGDRGAVGGRQVDDRGRARRGRSAAVTVARPRPEAPPVTRAEACRFMGLTGGRSAVSMMVALAMPPASHIDCRP